MGGPTSFNRAHVSCLFSYRRTVKLTQGQGTPDPKANFFLCEQHLSYTSIAHDQVSEQRITELTAALDAVQNCLVQTQAFLSCGDQHAFVLLVGNRSGTQFLVTLSRNSITRCTRFVSCLAGLVTSLRLKRKTKVLMKL